MRTNAPSTRSGGRAATAVAVTATLRRRSWSTVEALALACCVLTLHVAAGLALPLAAATHKSHSDDDGGGGGGETAAVPSYMLDLYQRYVSGAPPIDGSNTVHCIHATRVRTRSGDGDALEFDMETIGGSEALVRAELRLSRRAREAGGSFRAAERPLLLTMRASRVDDQAAAAAAAAAALAGDSEVDAGPSQPLWTVTLASAPTVALRSRSYGGIGGGGGGGWVAVGGWQTIDATQPIRRALSMAAGKIELLVTNSAAVSVALNESASAEPGEAGKSAGDATGRNGGGDSSGELGLFLSRHGLPYLLVYTNDTVNLTADQISSRLRLRDADSIRQEAESLVDPETGLLGGGDWSAAADASRRKRPAAAAAAASSSSSSSISSSAATESWRRIRKPTRLLPKRISRRDVADDNEIPGDPDVARRLRLPQHQRSPLVGQQLRRPRPVAAARTPAPSLPDVLMLRSSERFRSRIAKPQRASGSQLIPWPEVSDQLPAYARRRQSASKQGGDAGGGGGRGTSNSRRRTEQREQRKQKQANNGANVPAVSGASCGRKRLTLDFEDVGWGGWIIEPKSFDIHYCTGACEFPLSSAQQPTNHATIQSLLRAAGVRPDLPAPCCVPDRLSSVTLLYFDQRRNVVLKSYPGMTVESCACR